MTKKVGRWRCEVTKMKEVRRDQTGVSNFAAQRRTERSRFPDARRPLVKKEIIQF